MVRFCYYAQSMPIEPFSPIEGRQPRRPSCTHHTITDWTNGSRKCQDAHIKVGERGEIFQHPREPALVASTGRQRYGLTMREEIDKLLIYLGRLTGQLPVLQMVVGYLMSDPSRVRFVDSLGQSRNLAMAVSVHRRIELPMAPWQGYIRNVPVPDPLTWIQAARSMGGEIAVRISSDDPLVVQLLNPLVAPDRERQQRLVMSDRMQNLRLELDRALDLYNEVRHLMEVDQERQHELEKFLGMAEAEMQNMGQELTHIKDRLSQDTPPA